MSAVLRDRRSDAWSRVTATRLLGPSLREPRPQSPVASSTVSFVCGSRAFALATQGRAVYAREAAKTFSLGTHALLVWPVSGPVRENPVAIHPIGSPFPWEMWASPWTTLGRSLWNSSVCGKISRVARSASGLRPKEKCRCCQHQVATTFLGAACPDPSDTHPSCRGFDFAQVGLLPIHRSNAREIWNRILFSRDRNDRHREGRRADQRTTGNACRKTASRERERERGKRERKEKRRSAQQRTPSREQQPNQTHWMNPLFQSVTAFEEIASRRDAVKRVVEQRERLVPGCCPCPLPPPGIHQAAPEEVEDIEA